MSYLRLGLLRSVVIALAVVMLGTACSSSVTLVAAPASQAQPQNVETSTATETSTSAVGVHAPAVGTAAAAQAEETGTSEATPAAIADVVAAPTVGPDVSPAPEPASESGAEASTESTSRSPFADAANRPLGERIGELATLEDVDIDPKRVVDGVSLDSTWWGLRADVYAGEATPAGPIPEIDDLNYFCHEGYLEDHPKSGNRAERDWTAESAEYRRVEVSASAMLDIADAANSVQRHRLLLQNCAGVVSGDIVMDVVDGVHGQLLVVSRIDSDASDVALISTSFSVGSLVVRVQVAGDSSVQEQLVADVAYGLQAAVDAVDGELKRLGAADQLRPDLQEELTRLDGFCRGHNQWETSVGLSRTPLEYFEDVVGYFEGVQTPEGLGEQFDDFQRAYAEMLEALRLEPNLTDEELSEHPTWVVLRERYSFADALDAVWEFGRENC